jgi:methionyl-tRNA formyltransferase
MGSPAFAVPALEALAKDPSIEIPLVVTQPDRPAGRGRTMRPPEVKTAAESFGLRLVQPDTLQDESIVEQIRRSAPDVIVVVSYGHILRDEVLNLPRFGCLNVHPSLLPRYRGSLPIQAAILKGDSETGVSFIKLVRRMDAGPIVHHSRVPLSGTETPGELSQQLAEVAGTTLPWVVKSWIDGQLQAVPQNEEDATYTRLLKKSDAQINWRSSSTEIERFVRAMTPWPQAWTTIDGERISIQRADVVQGSDQISQAEPGSIHLADGRVLVGTGRDMLELGTVKPAGKREMEAVDWFRGQRFAPKPMFDLPERSTDPLIFRRRHRRH